MDWLILIVLVPLILVPIVLLCGFSGCGSILSIDDTPAPATGPPTGLVATGTGTKSIEVSWEDHSAGTVTFSIERAKLDPVPGPFSSIGSRAGAGVQKFTDDDVNLQEGTTFLYQLKQSVNVVAQGGTATTFPAAPAILEAVWIDIDRIRIRAKNNSAKAVGFILQRLLPSGAFTNVPLTGAPTAAQGGEAELTDTGLTEGSAHQYRVIATVEGFDSNLKKTVPSAPSAPPVSVSALQWKPCYPQRPMTQNVTDLNLLKNQCLVNRIKPPENLLNRGFKVRITLRAASTGAIAIARMSLSPAAVPGVPLPGNPNPNDWDSAANPTPVPLLGTPTPAPLPGIPGGILLPAGGFITLDPVKYFLDETKDLIIAFDFGGAAGAGCFASVMGCNVFSRANAAEALKADRSSGPADYLLSPNAVYFVEQIDVFG